MKTISFASLSLALASIVCAELPPLPLAESLQIQGITIETNTPPPGLVLRKELGLLTVDTLDGQVVHRTETRILETRATITPGGDYLLMFPEGDHYAKSKGEKMNTMLAYRSSDKGRTWQGPAAAFDIPYSQHGFIPFIPRGSKRLYAFGTQPVPGKWTHENGQRENAPIGYRWSDDDGRTWSDATLIEPVNDPGFKGMSVMRMTETDAGTWLLGSHLADWSVKPFTTRQYLLRSEDQGKTWTLLPGARPDGWFAEGFDRMDEGRPLSLDGGRVLFMSRTPAGRLFTAWSEDDGKTWTDPAPSSLVHPDAPPMLFTLSDGKTLAAFHHNKVPPTQRGDLSDHAELMKMRSELWVATSTDGGHTWSEPRFVLANAVQPAHAISGFNFQCSYLDAFTEDGVLHLFLPHRWQQVLHLTIKESALKTLPTKAQLQAKSVSSQSARVPLMETFRLAGRELNPAAPPLGLKTYSDLGLMIEESILGYELIQGQPTPPPAAAAASDTDTTGRIDPGAADLSVLTPLDAKGDSLVFPLSVKNCQIMLGLGGGDFPFRPEWQRFDNPRVLWSSYSKDSGRTWSEPRFLAALVDASEGAGIRKITLRPERAAVLALSFENGRGKRFEMRFKEYELRKLATVDDLINAPASRFVLRSTPAGSDDTTLADAICVGRDIRLTPDRLPEQCELRKDLGLIVAQSIEGQLVHTARSQSKSLFETRAVVTPKGDYLVFIPDGSHGNTRRKNGNLLTAYRSSDQGRIWQGPFYPFGEGTHYGVLPMVPAGSDRLHVFESLRDVLVDGRMQHRVFGSRHSDDDGQTWSQPEVLRLDNGRHYGGLCVIPITASETAAGGLFAGFHHGRVLRGQPGPDGRVWSTITLPKASESETPSTFTLDELQLTSLKDSGVLATARTTEGHLWEARSSDNGETWRGPRAMPLAQPDAPPMMARLNETTLIALHHNRAVMRSVCETAHSKWMEMPTPRKRTSPKASGCAAHCTTGSAAPKSGSHYRKTTGKRGASRASSSPTRWPSPSAWPIPTTNAPTLTSSWTRAACT